MDREGAADESHRRRAGAEPVQGLLAGRDHLGLVGEPEVVVGGEDHDVAPTLHPHTRALRRLQVIEAFVDAIALELLQLGAQAGREAHAISRMIFPASPERMAARASSMRVSGN